MSRYSTSPQNSKHASGRSVFRRIAFVLIVIFAISVFAAKREDKGERGYAKVRTPYVYPIVPGTPAWAELDSHGAMIAASTVPQAQLDRMSTAALLETVLTYPLLGDLLAYNTMQQGFAALESQSNAIAAFVDRPDAGAVLLARYKTMHPADVQDLFTDEEQGAFDIRFTYIETFLAQPSIQATLSAEEKESLLQEALKKAEEKLAVSEVFGAFGVERSALVAGRLVARTFHDSDIDLFLRDGEQLPIEKLDALLRAGQRKLGVEVQGLAVSGNDYTTTVKTPRGTKVPVYVHSRDWTRVQKALIHRMMEEDYPQAVRETDATRLYNCHSYAWYSQSTGNIYWMNSPGDDTYWKDGSFVFIKNGNGGTTIPSDIPNGAKVAYSSASDHSAIKASSTRFRSKWGKWPRMLHKPNYCPYVPCTNCSFPISYYRAR